MYKWLPREPPRPAPHPSVCPAPHPAAAPTRLCWGQRLAGPSLGLGQRGADSPQEVLGMFQPSPAPSSWSTPLGKMEPLRPYFPVLHTNLGLCPESLPLPPSQGSCRSHSPFMVPPSGSPLCGTRMAWEDWAPSDKPTAREHFLRPLECLKTA